MYSDVIAQTTGIDAWLDGHSHDVDRVMMDDKSGRFVQRQACGARNACVGVLTIATDGTLSTELFSRSASIPAPKLLGLSNPATERVADVKADLDERMDSVIATTGTDLVIYDPNAQTGDGKPVRIIQNAETNLRDLCADAYRNHYPEADVALVNADGIRASIDRGGIALNEILKPLPCGTGLDLIEVTGRQLLDALEWSVHATPAEFGGFEHVAGLTFEVDPLIASPCVEDAERMVVRVDDAKPRRVRNVRIGERAVDSDATYKLVTNVFS